ncbi:MAG: biotin synthase BioB [Bacteroidales bacterium]|nr:biotin synthase BioB [Bacteroidales bacterium]
MKTTELQPSQEITLLQHLEKQAVEGIPASIDDCIAIADGIGDSTDWNNGLFGALCDAADRVREAIHGDTADTCSIVNGRSGRCTEDCKWCAQSDRHNTGCREYDFISEQEYFDTLMANHHAGVRRFSIVCSGRKVAMNDIRRYCELYKRSRELSPISLCASMGLLNKEELQALYDAGVRRYHCNIETAASYFPALCTTHTREDKLRTIRYAHEVGMEVCSGGIIGMGENLRQRLEMAAESRDAGAVSIPVNLLNPIPGTPLQHTPLISERDVVLTVALMRLVAPRQSIRFAGGRARMSRQATARMLRGGANGAIVGDMLTTIGNAMDEDRQLFASAGLKI